LGEWWVGDHTSEGFEAVGWRSICLLAGYYYEVTDFAWVAQDI